MQKHCPNCNSLIINSSNQASRQIYCRDYCRKNANRKQKREMSRIDRRRANLRQNDEVIYLVRQCRRAGTVEILKGHSLKSFIETMDLVRNRPKGHVELCHIAPVKGVGSTGLFHCRNLFYAGAYQNRKNGRRYVSGGLFIENTKLDKRLAVDSSITTNEILLKIELYLGAIIPEYIARSPIRKSRKVSIINKILEVDSSAKFDNLMMSGYRELVSRWAEISHMKPVVVPVSRESKYIAYLDSLARFISYGGPRARVLKKLIRLMSTAYIALSQVKYSQTFNQEFYIKHGRYVKDRDIRARLTNPKDWSILKDLVYQAAFDALQGRDIDIDRLAAKVKSHLIFS
jgi:hypothetical protein